MQCGADDAMNHRRYPLAQRIGELKEQAAVADDFFTGREAGGDLRHAAPGLSESDQGARELVFAGLNGEAGRVFALAEYGGERHEM